MSGATKDPVARFFASAAVAVGALIFGLCGLCTLFFSGMSLVQVIQFPRAASSLLPFLLLYAVVGGLPAFGGFLLMRSGWRGLRPAKPKVDPKAFD